MNFGRVAFREIRFLRVGGETGWSRFQSPYRAYIYIYFFLSNSVARFIGLIRVNVRFFERGFRYIKRKEGRTKGAIKLRIEPSTISTGLIQFPFLITFTRLSWSQQLLSNRSREEKYDKFQFSFFFFSSYLL